MRVPSLRDWAPTRAQQEAWDCAAEARDVKRRVKERERLARLAESEDDDVEDED